jgi:hypothetical protein
MPFSPSIVPSGVDQDVYLELDQFGGPFGRAWRETRPRSLKSRLWARCSRQACERPIVLLREIDAESMTRRTSNAGLVRGFPDYSEPGARRRTATAG